MNRCLSLVKTKHWTHWLTSTILTPSRNPTMRKKKPRTSPFTLSLMRTKQVSFLKLPLSWRLRSSYQHQSSLKRSHSSLRLKCWLRPRARHRCSVVLWRSNLVWQVQQLQTVQQKQQLRLLISVHHRHRQQTRNRRLIRLQLRVEARLNSHSD